MSDIVVNKIINFKGADQLTPIANKVKEAIDGIKDKKVKLGATPEEQGITSFGQKLQGLPKDVRTTLKAMAEKNGFDTFEGYMKTVPKDKYTQLKANVEKGGFQAFKNDLESLPRSQQSTLKAMAEKEGFTTFEQYYQKVPKEARTKLDAIADTHDVDDFIRETDKIPKHVNTKVDADVNSGNSALSNFSSHIDKAKEKTSQFKSILAGSFVGSMMTTGLMSIVGGLKSATSAAMEYANAQQTMNATWKTLTGNAKDGQKMVDMTNKMAIAANNSTHMVDQLNQKFYSVNDSAATTKKLTTSVLTLQDAFGKTDDEVENFGTQWGQMVANGKVSAQDMMSFVNVFPKLRIELLKTEQKMTGNKDLTMKQLNDMISAGKVSSDTMDKVLEDTATKYGKATKNFSATIAGMKRTIQSQVPVLLSAFTEPFLNAQNPIYKTVSDWVADKRTKDKFSDLGKTISSGMSDAMSALSGGTGGQKDFAANLNRGIDSVNKGFKVFFGYITDHAKDLKTVGSSLNEILKVFLNAIWKDVGSIITTIGSGLGLMKDSSKDASDPLHAVADALKGIAKHKTAIKAIAGYLVAMKTFKMAKGAFDPLLKLAGIQSKGGGLLTKVVGSGKNEKKVFRFGTEGIAATKKQLLGLKDLLGKVTQGGKFSKVSAGNMTKGAKIGTGVTTAAVAGVATMDVVGALKAKNPEKKFEGFGKAAGGAIGGGIGFMLGGPAGEAIGATLGRMLGKLGGKAAKNFTDGWNKKGRGAKPPKGIIQKAGYYSRKAGDAVVNWTKGIATWMGKHKKEILLTLANPFLGIGAFILKDTKVGKDFRKWASNAIKNVQKGFKSFNKKAGKIGGGISKGIVKGMKGFGKLALYALAFPVGIGVKITKPLVKPIKKSISSLVKSIKKDWNGLTKWLGKIFNPIAKNWQKSWKKISKAIDMKKFSKDMSNTMSDMSKSIQKSSDDVGKQMSNMSKSVKKSKWAKDLKEKFNEAQKNADSWSAGMDDWWSGFSSGFSKSWNSVWSGVGSYFSKKFSGLSKWYSNFSSGMNSWWSDFSSNFKSAWHSVWQGVSDTFKNIFDGLKDIAKNAWNGIIGIVNSGIGAINGVIKMFGGKSLGKIKTLETGSNYHRGGLAKINDAHSSVYREIVKLPNGHMFSPQQRNVVLPLPQGSSVLPAQAARPYVETGLIPHYENGIGDSLSNFFDMAKSGISDAASGVGSWVSSKMKEIGGDIEKGIKFAKDFIKDPVGNLSKAFESVTNGKFAKEEFSSKMGPATGHGIVKAVADKVKSLAESFKKQLQSVTVSGKMPATAYGPMIKAAAAYMHQSITDFNVDMIERIIANESGGDPNITNNWDSNAKAGHPSTGILQYIEPTFMHYAMPGHTNIHSAFDQLIALFNDATWRSDMGMGYNGKYGEWRGQASGPSGPRLMANGGHVFNATSAIIGEDGDEFAINPAKSSAIPLLGDLIGRMADFHPEFRMSSNLTSNISSDIGRKLDSVINLLGSINGKNFQPEVNIARTSSNLNQQNRRDTDIYAYQRGMRQ